ncbi:hypothetical protein B0H13DRAFT_2338377 [Mycena leptocephala]|nr:hypothetical protein B0H13DRAFT_2338377 [Mycena leptocephala]
MPQRQPHQFTVTEARLNTIATYLTPAVKLLDDINDAFGSSFLQPISKTTLSLIVEVQKVKRNRDECIRLLENILQVLYAIVNLHIKSAGSLSPLLVDDMGKFTETLHKIHTFVEAQQDGSKIKYLFRQSEMNTLLKDCQSGLEEVLEVLKTETGIVVLNSIEEMRQKTENMQNDLLELISTLSDGTLSDGSSSVYLGSNPSQNR